ncbi:MULTISPECIES: hypothetical protein [Methanobacterium]|jgi:hypothetical protein|uniref:Uncharacterized protein n=1 Tax=Methanobacterium bryantii TaxID=2161 RepID=A0A2A2H5K7_METBR|nr:MULTISPECIES: hypothetical protein [Methanobacterium]OEC88364.1 hypothetical protein A9507_05510 [Methanobacterium sp. A39]PAV04553.1 hypothetical protein ASJ80_06925 [Methanobacterium bryantii]
MNSLLSFAEKNLEELVTPFGQTDVLLLYAIAAGRLKKYLGDRELAGKIWMPSGRMRYLIKRGSKLEPLFAHELEEAVTLEFLELRSKTEHLSSAKKEITDVQAKVWQYFLPRKLSDFFYATNHEGPGKEIDRIFFDIDRSNGISAEQAQETTQIFVETIKEDQELEELLGNYDLSINWTGNSFHVLFFLDELMPSPFYDEHFQYSKNDPERNFTGKWAKKINEQVEFKVAGGHERQGNSINIDPSQSPSGKLCRVPLGSLHMENPETINGISVPITEKMLYNEDLISKLTLYTPKDIIKNLSEIEKNLPERFR